MCIVVTKSRGTQFPSKKFISACCDNNPDGFAMAWNEHGEVKNFKTLSKKEFMKQYAKVSKMDFKATGLVVHARIKTHGSIKLENTHCWIADGFAFAHNGILTIANRGDMTDSQTFFEDIFRPVYAQGGWTAAERAIQAVIGTSKFAFIDGEGRIQMFGQYIKVKDGLYASNSSYEERVWNSYGTTRPVGYYGSNNGWRKPASVTSATEERYYDYMEMRWVRRTTESDQEWAAKKKTSDAYNEALWNSYLD